MTDTEKIKAAMKKKPEPKWDPPIPDDHFLSTGATVLNLACSGRVDGGFAKGHCYLLAGKSRAGKTFAMLSAIAEATVNHNFDDYDIIFDGPENGDVMDKVRLFGERFAKRVRPPIKEKNHWRSSRTIEEVYYNIHDLHKEGCPFLYCLDSWEALTSEAEEGHFEERKREARGGKEAAGSMGAERAKLHSKDFRIVNNACKESGSIFISISQERENIKQQWGDKRTRAGGKALTFFATLEIWFSIKEAVKKEVFDKDRELGNVIIAQIKKNRIEPGHRSIVEFPILHKLGIDDIGSCVDYLIDEKQWKIGKKGNRNVVVADDFELELPREQLIESIEDEHLENDLRKLVGRVWREIEEACTLHRKPRYV